MPTHASLLNRTDQSIKSFRQSTNAQSRRFDSEPSVLNREQALTILG